ncbi:MAG: hypothetical protein V3Q69_12450 [Burkholderia sp.]
MTKQAPARTKGHFKKCRHQPSASSPEITKACHSLFHGRCCINRARSVDVYAQRSRGQPPIKSDSRVTA